MIPWRSSCAACSRASGVRPNLRNRIGVRNVSSSVALIRPRLTPVLMTALSAGVALVPLLYDAASPGKEILHPVAVAEWAA
jgi:Cu/Ag efflux pump CusA